jgi:Na+/H+-dicarboxylate symporter
MGTFDPWGGFVSFVRTYTRPRVFAAAVLGSLVVGAGLGVLARTTGAGWLTDLLDQLGTIFTTLLQIAVIPLVFTAIVVGITSLRGLGRPRGSAARPCCGSPSRR